MPRLISVALLAALLGGAGCKNAANDADLGPDIPDTEAVRGAHINKVTVNQAVQIIAMKDGEDLIDDEDTNLGKVVAGREGVIRVFLDLDDDWDEREITGVLYVDGLDPKVETITPSADSENGTFSSTINFELTPEEFTEGMSYSVELRESEDGDYGGDVSDSSWPEDGEQDLLVEESAEIEIRIIPIRYNADGSGRLPDTSDSVIKKFKREARKIYPAHTVTITVADPMNWNQDITAFNGWDQLLYSIAQDRQSDDRDVRANTYYYGLFNPSSSLGQFCSGGGCVLGLSLLGGPNDVWSRASIGLGYDAVSVATLVHEVGHAQGREHSNCGLYGQPYDRQYPYEDAKVGGYGYDIVADELVPPNRHRDVMSYCEPYWVSDYTYDAMLRRMQKLESQRRTGGDPTTYRTFFVDGQGNLTRASEMEVDSAPSGELQTLEVTDVNGHVLDYVDGYFAPYSHLDGGMLMVPDDAVLDAGRLRLMSLYNE